MARPTLLSERTRSSEPAADAATPTGALTSDPPRPEGAPDLARPERAPDLAQWLTRDLRVKGSPSERPAADSQPVERPSQPHTVVITESREPELASWLLQDLKPRGSVPPEALSTTLLASKWESAVPPRDELVPGDELVPRAAPPPPDSLVPHAVSEAPAALALRDAALDDEDLAVLPSRRGKKRDFRKVVVLAALLSVAGAVLWVASAPQVQEIAGSAASAAPAVLTAPLPPPPPSDTALPEPPPQPEPSAPASSAGQGSGAAAPAAALDSASEPRGRRAGDAVARFADLPSPTLSRLAREEQQRLRKAASSRAAGKQPAGTQPATKPEP